MVNRTSIRIVNTSKIIANVWSFYCASIVNTLTLIFHTFARRAEIRVLRITAIRENFRAVFSAETIRTTFKFWNSTLIGLLVAFFERSDTKTWRTHQRFFVSCAACEFLALWIIRVTYSIGAKCRFRTYTSIVNYFFAFFIFRFFFFKRK